MKVSKCMFPDCDENENCRGLCHTHYHTAAKQVSRGRTTWKKLEAAGRCKPATKKRGRPPTVRNFFLKGAKPN